MLAAAEAGCENIEILYVIDGPTDDSVNLLKSMKTKDERIRIIELSRNFGHHKAMLTGIAQSRGEEVFIIDCDLEEPPELLSQFLVIYNEERPDVVYGVQESRKGNLFERLSGRIFYGLFNLLAEVKISPNLLMARIMSRRYVDSLLTFEERSLFLGGVFALVGYDQRAVVVKKGSRQESSYSVLARIALMIDAITSSTHRLLSLVFYLGLSISGVSFAMTIYYLISSLFFKEYLGGWPSLMLSIWFLSGLMILSIGIVGMYIAKMFIEVKARPHAVIKQEW